MQQTLVTLTFLVVSADFAARFVPGETALGALVIVCLLWGLLALFSRAQSSGRARDAGTP